ncbi:hypothetical protein ABPG74_001591 [Tetrahymena malaccensis]
MQKKQKYYIESDDCEFNLNFYQRLFKSLKDQLEVHRQSSDIQFNYKNNLFFLFKGNKSGLNLQKIKKDLFDQTFSVKLENKELTKIIKQGSRTVIRYIQCVSKENENNLLRIVKYKFEKKFVVIHFFQKKKKNTKKNIATKTVATPNSNISINSKTSEKVQSKTSSKNEESLTCQQENSQTLQIHQSNQVKQEKQLLEQSLKTLSPPSLNTSLNSSIQIIYSQQKKTNSKDTNLYEKQIQKAPIQLSQQCNQPQQQPLSSECQLKKEFLSNQNDYDLQHQMAKQADQITRLKLEKNNLAYQLRIEMQKALHFEDLYLQLRSQIVKQQFNSLKQNGFNYLSTNNYTKQYQPSEDFTIKQEDNQIEQIELE